MIQNHKPLPASGLIVLVLVLISVIATKNDFVTGGNWSQVLVITLPLLIFTMAKLTEETGKRIL